ncbi:MAG: DoxX family protein [Opitutales bacterium]
MKFLQLKFIPQSSDFALLLLRLWLGLTLLINHGLPKLMHFGAMSEKFMDPFHIGTVPSLSLAVLAEVVAPILLVLGLLTRFSALVIVIELGVAFVFVHGLKLSGPGSGELAFVYVAGFATLLFAGGGKFAVDGKSGG